MYTSTVKVDILYTIHSEKVQNYKHMKLFILSVVICRKDDNS